MQTREQAERDLRDWALNNARRDTLVRNALRAGLTKTEIHTITGIARTTIDRILEAPPMATTTSYGTWNNKVERYSLTVEQSVFDALGDYADDYDREALTAAYRDAINDALPDGVTLAGDEFIGPHQPADDEFDGHPHTEDGALDIKAIVETIDFWEIAAKHDTSDDE